MNFCPDCGSIMMPKNVDGKKVIKCACGYESKDKEVGKLGETGKKVVARKIEVIHEEIETLPECEEECPRCGNRKAYWWEVQTRAADESPTKFLKCAKCKHQWRDYN